MSEPEAPIRLVVVPVTPFRQNCCLVICTATGEAAILDPGGDADLICKAVEETGARVTKVLLTHGHLDHAGAATELARRYAVPIEGPQEADRFLLDRIAEQAVRFGVDGGENVAPDRWLVEGDTVAVGKLHFQVYHTPGHTPGHVIFHLPELGLALVGDVLFNGSIGRTDLPGGDLQTLIRSITTKLWPLGDQTAFLPGHGSGSTFGNERRLNPWVSDFALSRGEY